MAADQKREICPKCGQEDATFYVRKLYLESLSFVKPGDETATPDLDRFFEFNGFANESSAKKRHIVEDLIKSFAPPSGKPELLKTISPDMMVVIFSAVALFILYQIYATQYPIFFYTLGLFLAFLASYIIFHKKIIARYKNQRDLDTSSKEVIEKAVGKWMKLSYCSRDNVIFGEKKAECVPLDEMNSYLLKSSVKAHEK